MFWSTNSFLEIYDIRELRHPRIIGRYVVDQGAGFRLQNGRLYLSTEDRGLYVYDYSSPDYLVFVSSHAEIPKRPRLELEPKRLRARSGNATAVYNISRPGPPRLLEIERSDPSSTDNAPVNETVRELRRRGEIRGMVQIEGERIYSFGQELFFIHDLKTGNLLGQAPGRFENFHMLDSRIYTVQENRGLVIYDVSNPAQIEVVSHTPFSRARERYFCICGLANGCLFCSDVGGELRIYRTP